MKILTSMNRRIYLDYGQDMLDRVLRFMPPKMETVVYWDGQDPPRTPGERLQFRHLERVDGFLDFRTFAEKYQFDKGIHNRQNAFLWNAQRFCCKGFAWGDYLPDEDVIWLDADVKVFDHVPGSFLQGLVRSKPYTYLGREKSYTETGFLAFNHRWPESYFLRRIILEMYRTHKVFSLAAWTDCHVFDHARSAVGGGENLSPAGKNFDHVFNGSILGRYMDHCKGPRKKKGFSPETWKSVEHRDHGVHAASG